MAKYITKEEALNAVEDAIELTSSEYDMIAEKIDNVPAADVAPVVRCKDCEYSYKIGRWTRCSHGICCGRAVQSDFYCARGKRREPTHD